MSDLNVELILRLIYQGAGAKAAKQDLEALGRAAKGLGGARGPAELNRELQKTAGAAGAAAGRLSGMRAATGSLASLRGPHTLAADLGRAGAAADLASGKLRAVAVAAGAAGQAAGRLTAFSTAAARLGQVRGPDALAADLGKAAAAADRAGDKLRELGTVAGTAGRATGQLTAFTTAAAKLGPLRGPVALKGDLERTGAAADTAGRKLDELATKAGRARDARGRFLPGGGGFEGDGLPPSRRRDFARGAGEGARDAAYLVPGMTGAMAGAMTGAGFAGAAGIGGIAGIGLAAAGATRKAIELESAMAEIRKAVDGLDDAGLKTIEQDILRVTRQTPLAATEVAKLYAQAGFAGRPKEDLKDFAVFSAKAAVAFGMGAEETGDKLAKLGNVFKLNQAQIEDTANAVNLLGDTTAAKERDIIEFLTRTGSGAQLLKMTANQTAALGSAMLELGTAPEVAATGANALMTKLATAGKQGKDFQASLRAIGLDAKKVGELLREGPAEALLEIGKRIEALNDEKKIDVLEGLGGGQYVDDFARLFGNLNGLKRAFDRVNDAKQRVGSVDKTFEIFNETTESKVKRLGNAFSNLGMTIGASLSGPLSSAAEQVTGFLNRINEANEKAVREGTIVEKLAKGDALTSDEQALILGRERQFEARARYRRDEDVDADASRRESFRRARAALDAEQPALAKNIAELETRASETLANVGDTIAHRMVRRRMRAQRERLEELRKAAGVTVGEEVEGPPIPSPGATAPVPAPGPLPPEPPESQGRARIRDEERAAAAAGSRAARQAEHDAEVRAEIERRAGTQAAPLAPSPAAGVPEARQMPTGNIEELRQKLAAARQEADALRAAMVPLQLAEGFSIPAADHTGDLAKVEQTIREIEEAIRRLSGLSAAPGVDTGQIASAETKAQSAGPAIKTALDVTAKPVVDTSSIDAAIARAGALKTSLSGIGAAAGARPAGGGRPAAPSPTTSAGRTAPASAGGPRTASLAPRFSRANGPAREGASPASPRGRGERGRGGIHIATVNVHGVRDLAGLERQMMRVADRDARNTRDNALHDVGRPA